MDKEFTTILSQVDDELITRFREVVNDSHMFVFHTYSNRNGKNQWNPICSCMDWISVAIRSIYGAPSFSTNIDVKVMQIYSLISSIDIVNESIISLHSIFKSKKGRVSPFKGANNCFESKSISCDDDSYFKEIRARFGAHPINLDGENGERLFASWPHDGFDTEYDIQVRLYSNVVGNDDKTFGIKISELLTFLVLRYSYLNTLIEEISHQYSIYCEGKSAQPIPRTPDILKQIDILEKESEIRLDNDYYRSTILDLKMIFGCNTGLVHLQEQEAFFKDSQKLLLEEVLSNLQNMNLVDLVHCDTLSRKPPERELSYELPKLYSWIYSERYDSMLDYYMRRLNKISNEEYEFSESDGPVRTFLKLKLFLYSFNDKE